MSTIVFTSLASNYLPKARVLYRSLKARHPELHFTMVLVDKDDTKGLSKKLLASSADEVLGMRELMRGRVPNIESWAFGHNLVELCTAVKGAAFQEFFDRGVERVMYLDPDILVLDSLRPVLENFRNASILLTPHSHSPEDTLERIGFIECGLLMHGIYNLGFLGVRNDRDGRKFVKWWSERLLHWCLDDYSRGLFTDQKWIDLVPGFFEGVRVLRDPGLNVARWNMGALPVTRDRRGKYLIGGQPIRFFHFSGIESGEHMKMLERFARGCPNLRALTEEYVALLEREGGSRFIEQLPGLDCFSNGMRCTQAQRSLYRERIDLQKAFPRPRQVTVEEPCFLHWYKEDLRRSLGQQTKSLEFGRLAEFLSVTR